MSALNPLSFSVHEIHTRIDGCTVFYETILRSFSTEERLTVRGKPWPIGAKVDFTQLACTPRDYIRRAQPRRHAGRGKKKI